MTKLKVLIVDDNKRMTSSLESILTDDDEIQVIGKAEDGQEALGMIRETEPDLVLLDLIMPKLDGIGVLEHLRQDATLKKRPEVIVVSGIVQDGITNRAFELGAAYYKTV